MIHYDDHSQGQVTSLYIHDRKPFNGILHRSMAIALKVAKQMSNIMFHESLGSKHWNANWRRQTSLLKITRTQALSTSPTCCASNALLFQEFKNNGKHLAILHFRNIHIAWPRCVWPSRRWCNRIPSPLRCAETQVLNRGRFCNRKSFWEQISWTPNVTLSRDYMLTISATRGFPNISWKKWRPLGISISFTLPLYHQYPSIFTKNFMSF